MIGCRLPGMTTPAQRVFEFYKESKLQFSFRTLTSTQWLYQQLSDPRGITESLATKLSDRCPEAMESLGIEIEDLVRGRMPEDELEAS